MNGAARWLLRALEGMSWGIGAVMFSLYATALVGGELGRRQDVELFMRSIPPPDQSLWSGARVAAFNAAQNSVVDKPIGVLRIPSLSLTVPIYATSTELHLNRGVGLIERMAGLDESGNVGIAGHRDGFFRALKDISAGALIEIQTPLRVRRYRVASTQVVPAKDTRPLADTAEPTLTLVTCHPFYYLGPAPQRFIVHGTYTQ